MTRARWKGQLDEQHLGQLLPASAEEALSRQDLDPTAPTPTVQEIGAQIDTLLLRPVKRPPTALLCILDDDSRHGEWVRLRQPRVVLGRDRGEIVVPHDPGMSRRHAELTRGTKRGAAAWRLRDLNSRQGTYVRIRQARLRHNQELLIGSRHYRFDAPPQDTLAPRGATAAESGHPPTPASSPSVTFADASPALVEVTAIGEGTRHPLKLDENWIGRTGPLCAVALPFDPHVSPRHARLSRDKKGRWKIEDTQSLNGTWLRIDEMTISTVCEFLLGEQHFLLRVR